MYFPGVRAYGVTVGCLAALLTAIVARPDSAGVVAEARVLLELLVPLPLVLVSAGLLQADPALRLLAAQPVQLGGLLMARWTLALVITLVAPMAVHTVAAVLEPGSSVQALTWLAPTLFLSAMALAFAAAGARRGLGLGVAIAYWAVSLFLAPVLQSRCAETLSEVCGAAVWSTAYGLVAGGGVGWSVNRALLLFLALFLVIVTMRAYRDPERHVRSLSTHEVSA